MRYGSISYVVAILLLCKSSTSIHHAFVLPILHIQRSDNNIKQYKQSISTIPLSVCYSSSGGQDQEDDIPNTTNNNNNSQPKRRIQYEYEYGKH